MGKLVKFHIVGEPLVDESAYVALADYLNLRVEFGSERDDDETLRLCLKSAAQKVEYEGSHHIFARQMASRVQFVTRLELPFLVNLPVSILRIQDAGQDVPVDRFKLQKCDTHYELVRQGRVEQNFDIDLLVGYRNWTDVPDYLRVLVLGVAAHIYEARFSKNTQLPIWIREELMRLQNLRLGFV